MLSVLQSLLTHPAAVVLVLFLCGAVGMGVWEYHVQPLLIPKSEILAEVDVLIEKHGSRAEEFAFIEEDSAWRRSDAREQGKWRRVRRELWRRFECGEWR